MKQKNIRKIDGKLLLITALLLLAVLGGILQGKSGTSMNYEENQHKEIVVLFDTPMSGEELKMFVSNIGLDLKVISHMNDYALLQTIRASKVEEVIHQISQQPHVRVAEINGSIKSFEISKDAYSNTQWGLHNPGEYLSLTENGDNYRISTEDVDMDVLEGWQKFNKTVYKKEVVVALLDTGVDYKHPDLADQMWINQGEIPNDGIDNDENGYIDDVYGWDFYNNDSSVGHYLSNKEETYTADPEDDDNHGTHIAGIIAAKADNEIGIAGVASNINVRIMALKVNGGTKGTGSIAGAIEAIKYATLMGADICNMSWGTSQKSDALRQVMVESDMLFVAAAGNTGANNDEQPIYPANFKLDNLIAVTFINANGKLTRISNYGAKSVDLAAPGDDIFSTIVGSYGYMSGSSMAAPHVSSIAAMLYAYQDKPYPSNIKKILLSSLKPMDQLEGKLIHPGIPSALQAVLNKDLVEVDTKTPKLSLKTLYQQDKMMISIKATDEGKSKIRVLKWLKDKKEAEDFRRGMDGFLISNDEMVVVKDGNYTIYVSDYAGNEQVKTYNVKADETSPKISATYTVSKNYKTRTIAVNISDLQSGIKRVKYMSGKKKAKEFLPAGAGTEVKLVDGKAQFKVKKDGVYTIFASDYRGNLSVKTIDVKTVKSTDVKFVRTYKNMKQEEVYILRPFIKPVKTTDMLTYVSTNPKVATVSKDGRVKAINPGSTYVTVKTASGKLAICKIIVKN